MELILDSAGDAATSIFRPYHVVKVIRESRTISSFHLVPADGKGLSGHLPGQHVSLRIPTGSGDTIRSYTLSDRPGLDHWRISVKRESDPPGVGSSWLHDMVQAGSSIEVGPPSGSFTLDLMSEAPVALVSAGVGITPMMAMLESLVAANSRRPVWFIHGARDADEQAFATRVAEIAASCPNIRVHIRFSRGDASQKKPGGCDAIGRIDARCVLDLIAGTDPSVYLCGPSGFIADLQRDLVAAGVSAERLHHEFFGRAQALAGPAGMVAKAGFRVVFRRAGRAMNWGPAALNLLELAEQAGLAPDSGCRSGICHSCACTLIDGRVRYLEPPAVPPGPGQVLICCATPDSDLVLDL